MNLKETQDRPHFLGMLPRLPARFQPDDRDRNAVSPRVEHPGAFAAAN
jgi:hypothetical protein